MTGFALPVLQLTILQMVGDKRRIIVGLDLLRQAITSGNVVLEEKPTLTALSRAVNQLTKEGFLVCDRQYLLTEKGKQELASAGVNT